MSKRAIEKIKRHTFSGKSFKFIYDNPYEVVSKEEIDLTTKYYNVEEGSKILALTDARNTNDKKIIISDEIEDDKELLRVLLDEAVHAFDDRINNDVVDIYARDLSEFLWRCGFRRTE